MMFWVMTAVDLLDRPFLLGPGHGRRGPPLGPGMVRRGFPGNRLSGLAYAFWYDALRVLPSSRREPYCT